MEFFHIFSVILVISAIFAYINQQYVRPPTAIALLPAGLLLSLVVQGLTIEPFIKRLSNRRVTV